MQAIEAADKSHGGRRTGAGRKPNRERYAEAIDAAEAVIAENLSRYTDNLDAIAGGKNPGSKTVMVAAGTVIIERVLFYKDPRTGKDSDQPLQDRNGKPMVGKVCAFPDLDPDALVCIKREVVNDGMDAKANMYLIDRIGGKASALSNDPPEIDNDRLEAALAALEAASARPDVPPDVKEILAQASQEIGASLLGED